MEDKKQKKEPVLDALGGYFVSINGVIYYARPNPPYGPVPADKFCRIKANNKCKIYEKRTPK